MKLTLTSGFDLGNGTFIQQPTQCKKRTTLYDILRPPPASSRAHARTLSPSFQGSVVLLLDGEDRVIGEYLDSIQHTENKPKEYIATYSVPIIGCTSSGQVRACLPAQPVRIVGAIPTILYVPDQVTSQPRADNSRVPSSISGRLAVCNSELFENDRFALFLHRGSMVINPLSAPLGWVTSLTPANLDLVVNVVN